MRMLLLIGFTALASLASGQANSSDVLTQMKKYSVGLTDITLNAQPLSTDYAFDMKYEVAGQYPVTYLATYDPSRNPAWKMTSWNGNPPEKYQMNTVTDRAKALATAPVIVDESTLKSTMEGNYLVISFRINPNTAPKEYMYLKDCDGKAYINTSTGKLEKTVWDNFQPTKSGIVKINKIHEEVFFNYSEGVYHVAKETQSEGGSVSTKAGEMSGEASEIITYSNYRKVK